MGRKKTGGAKAARRGGAAAQGGLLAKMRSWARAVGISAVVGGVLAGGFVLGTMYRHAVAVVETRLGGPVWTVPGHVWSGPIELWPGLAADPDALAKDLAAAGYARVDRAAQPGDFEVTPSAVLVKARAASGPGWEVKGGDVLVTFADGRVRSVSPGGRASFAPSELATVRGPDNEDRSPVPLERIPLHVRRAVMAMEDARFYEHPGIDALGVARALIANLVDREWSQGGSSITQQLAKNVFLSAERTARRKSEEALIAIALERSLEKDEILQLYLNEIYLGQAGGSAICGVDAAARAFFGKPIERVSLGEAATIAGIISAPNPYSPIRHPDAARERRDLALDRMVATGWADAADAKAEQAKPLDVHVGEVGRRAPWVVDLAVERVEAAQGQGAIARDALEVYTTVSPTLQRVAERAVAEGLAEVEAAHPSATGVQVALVVVRARDGAIVAHVGGRDYARSPYDRGAHAERQVGSVVKPLVALAAFEADPTLSPAQLLDDAPLTRTHDGKSWSPSNYDGAFVGPIPLRRAIAQSRNIPAILLAERVGLGELRGRLRALGLSGATDYPSASLGGFGATPTQLAGAYAVFAGGAYHTPWALRAATKGTGTAAERVLDLPPAKADVRYSERATFLARDVMREVLDTGTGRAASKWGVKGGAAGKSGTTDREVDAWFAGVTGPYAVVVWVGHDKGKGVGLTGSKAALPIWARFVSDSGTSDQAPTPPPSVVEAEVCASTGLPPCPDCAEVGTEWFPAGAVPEARCGLPGLIDGLFREGGDATTDGERSDEGQPRRNVFQQLGDWLSGR